MESPQEEARNLPAPKRSRAAAAPDFSRELRERLEAGSARLLALQLFLFPTVPLSAPWNDNSQFSSAISPPHIDGNLPSSAFERRTVSFHQVQFSLPFGGSKSRSSIFRPKTGRYNFVVLHVQICHNSYSFISQLKRLYISRTTSLYRRSGVPLRTV